MYNTLMECVIEECATATLRACAPDMTSSILDVTAQTRGRERASERAGERASKRALMCGICIVHCTFEEYRYTEYPQKGFD